MLGDIRVDSNGLIDEYVRSVVALEDDPALGLPEMKIDGCYLKRDTFRKLMKPYLGKKEVTEADEQRFRLGVVDSCWRNWSGVTLRNLSRASEFVVLNYAALKKAFADKGLEEDTEIAWDIDDAKWVASKLNGEVFQRVQDGLQDMEKYATEIVQKEKNS